MEILDTMKKLGYGERAEVDTATDVVKVPHGWLYKSYNTATNEIVTTHLVLEDHQEIALQAQIKEVEAIRNSVDSGEQLLCTCPAEQSYHSVGCPCRVD